MPIRFFCPLGHRLQTAESQQGKLVHCPVCQQRVIVPVVDFVNRTSSESLLHEQNNSFPRQPHPQLNQSVPLVFGQQGDPEPASSFKVAALAEFDPAALEPSLSEELGPGAKAGALLAERGGSPQGQERQSLSETATLSGSREPLLVEVSCSSGQEAPILGAPNQPDSAGSAGASGGPADAGSPTVPSPSATVDQPGCLEDLILAELPPASPSETEFEESLLEEFHSSGTEPSKQDLGPASPETLSLPLLPLSDAPSTTPSAHPAGRNQGVCQNSRAEQALARPGEERAKKWDSGLPSAARELGAIPRKEIVGCDSGPNTPSSRQTSACLEDRPGRQALPICSATPANGPGRSLSAPLVPPKLGHLVPMRRHEVRWLGFWLGLIVLFSIGPAFRHLLLSSVPGWARVVVLLGLWELAYVAWMVLTVHRTALWVVMVVFAAGAVLSAATTAFTLAAPAHTMLAGGLGQIRRWAPSWFGCVLAVQMLGAYLAGRLAYLWGQMDRRFIQHRLADW